MNTSIEIINLLTEFKFSQQDTNALHQQIDDLFDICQELTSDYDESHDVNHHLEVLKNALGITVQLESKSIELITIVIFASILHDIVDTKYLTDIEIKRRKLIIFLNERSKIVNKSDVLWVIDNISFSSEVKYGYPTHPNPIVQLARDIVSDADKLESIGDIGIHRCIVYTQAINPNLSPQDINNLVIQHCHDKLIKIKDQYMRTIPGKTMAIPRHDIIAKFIRDIIF